MRRSFTSLLLAVLGLVGRAAAADLVKIEGGAVHHLHPEAAQTAVRIPVQTEKDVAFEELRFELVSVRRGHNETPALMESFRVEAQPATTERGPAVIVSAEAVLAAGTYDLRLNVHLSSTEDVQRLDLQVVRPAAQLSPPGTLKVERVLPLLLLEGETRQQALVLHETSDDTSVSDIEIVQISGNAADGRPVAGTITFAAPSEVPPGSRVQVEYELTGDFGLGDASVKASLDAPQLANALELDVSIATRRHPALVFVLLAGGLLIGYLLRALLQSAIELGEAKEQARRALEELERAVCDRADTSFRSSLDQLVGQLRDAVERGKAAAIANISGEVGAEIQKAVADLQKREVEVRKQLDDLLGLVTKRWTLPPEVAAAVRRGREAAREADVGFDPGDPEPTRAACERIRSALLESVGESARSWRDESRRVLRELQASREPLIQRLRAEPNELDGLKAAVDAVPVDDPRAVIGDLVGKTHKARVMQLDVTDQLRGALRALLQQWTRKLADLQAASDDLRAGIQNFWQELERSSADPIAIVDLVLASVDALHQSLAAAIRQASPNERDEQLTAYLEAGEYDQAMERADQLRRDRARIEGVPLGEASADSIRAADLGLAPAPERERVPPGRGSVPHRGAPWPGLRMRLDRGRTMAELMRAKFLQTAIYAVLILFGGYALFAGGFVGTTEDFARIFFWAFGIDLGAEAVTSLATQLKGRR